MKTVAIVGSHSSAQAIAPFDRADVDIWVFNALAGKRDTWVKRCDAVFQMHPPAIYRSPHNREDPYHWRWLQEPHPFPIYMLDADPDVPAAVRYPLDEICAELLPGWHMNSEPKRYFSSSIDYAIALAIYQGYERIELYGVEMSSDTEYTYQRVGVALWAGIALGRGIEFHNYGGEAIFDRPLYGYEGNLEHDINSLTIRAAELNEYRKQAQTLVFRAEAQLSDLWTAGGQLPEAIGVLRETRKRYGYFDAAHDEVRRYLHRAQAARDAGQVAFIDRNEHETATGVARGDCQQHDRLMKETAGMVNVTLQSWLNGGEPQALAWLKKFVNQHAAHAEDLGRANGIMNENMRLMQAADLAITAAGGEKAMEYAQAAEGDRKNGRH